MNAVIHLNFTNEWLTSTTLQYSSLDEEWGLNFRLNYIYRTGDDVFFIVNQIRSPKENFWSVFAHSHLRALAQKWNDQLRFAASWVLLQNGNPWPRATIRDECGHDVVRRGRLFLRE